MLTVVDLVFSYARVHNAVHNAVHTLVPTTRTLCRKHNRCEQMLYTDEPRGALHPNGECTTGVDSTPR